MEDAENQHAAGNDIKLLATQEQHDAVIDQETCKKGTFSSKTTTTQDEWHDSMAIVTTLRDTVSVAAGHALLGQGAQIAGAGDLVLAAGHDLALHRAKQAQRRA